jgi:hypothetical protein
VSSASDRRNRQNALTLIGALVASLGIVLAIVLVTVRPEVDGATHVDWHAVHDSAPNASALVDPSFTAADGAWWSNRADYTESAHPEWYLGFITPTNEFVAVHQFLGDISPDITAELDDVAATATTIAGVEWQVIDRSTVTDAGNDRVILLTPLPSGGSLIVAGTADKATLHLVAERALRSLKG